MPRGGNVVLFFRPGDWSFALKSCPRGGDFDKAQGSARGMVTGQIDTWITSTLGV